MIDILTLEFLREMVMERFIEGADRDQSTLFPERLDDFMLCRRLDLFAEAIVGIDGSKFKTVNNRDKNFTPAKMKRRLEQIDKSIARYLGQLDSADPEEPSIAAAPSERLDEKITALKEEMQRLKALEAEMSTTPDKQLSLTDPDARSMKTRGNGIVGYNLQTAVDAEHHLIVAHDVKSPVVTAISSLASADDLSGVPGHRQTVRNRFHKAWAIPGHSAPSAA